MKEHTLKKNILVIYHSQGGTMKRMAESFARGAAKEPNITVVFKKAAEASLEDLLACRAIAIGSPEYFGTMAGMIKDFFDRTYEAAKDKTTGLPFIVFVCAGNDGRGAITQIERIAAGYKWKQVQEHLRVAGPPTAQDLAAVEELGQTLAAGVDFGIF
ncbi:flavodoxin [Desulfopila sp. IMCC35006]|uniref:flavodoxin family protein n=1 Tax=Desulfopila sp. IMCC35006 TaxID=2569542 RepID=UPI0010AD855C|nr:NAD(P)H-dependent oxidoreductase [Desulfopila sp. IMCC35006]TKB24814.1 flavodoxin [Desulfopila sp. IMCC35006]